MNEPTFSTDEVAEILGVSYRMLDYYERNGHITIASSRGPGTGHGRRWTQEEVLRLRVCLNMVHGAKEIMAKWRSGALWRGE